MMKDINKTETKIINRGNGDNKVTQWTLLAANTLIMLIVLVPDSPVLSVPIILADAGAVYYYAIYRLKGAEHSFDVEVGHCILTILFADITAAIMNYIAGNPGEFSAENAMWMLSISFSFLPVLWIALIVIGMIIYAKNFKKNKKNGLLLWFALELMGLGLGIMFHPLFNESDHLGRFDLMFMFAYSVLNLIWIGLFSIAKAVSPESARAGIYTLFLFGYTVFFGIFGTGNTWVLWNGLDSMPVTVDNLINHYLSGLSLWIIMGSILAAAIIQILMNEKERPESLLLISFFDIILVILAVHNHPYPFGVIGIPVMIIILVKLQGKDQQRRESGRENGVLSLISACYAVGISGTIILLSQGKGVFVVIGLIVLHFFLKAKKNFKEDKLFIMLMVWFTLQAGLWVFLDYYPALSLDEYAGSGLMYEVIDLTWLLVLMIIAMRLTTEKHPALPDFMVLIRPVYALMLIILLTFAVNSSCPKISFNMEGNVAERDNIEITIDNPEWVGEWYWTKIGEFQSYPDAKTTSFQQSSGSIDANGDFLHVIATDGLGSFVHRVYYYPEHYRNMGEYMYDFTFD